MAPRALRDVLSTDSPIVLGPFGGLSSIDLTAAVSEAGGLGSYGLYGYDGARIAETAAQLRAATTRPFALNLWLPTGDEAAVDDGDLERVRSALAPLFAELGLPLPEAPARFLPPVEEQLDAVLAARPAALSVVYGVPAPDVVAAARERGIALIGTATTVAEAQALAAGGVDAVVATGAEAAGHRVSFLAPPEDSLVGTLALVPQVVDAVDVPVIAAGGIADRRGVAAAFALGASGVQVGTAFLRTRQSAATAGHRRAITHAHDTSAVLTRAMSGRLARGIPNAAMRLLEQHEILPFPAQNWLTGQFRAAAAQQGRADLVSLWAGQAAALSVYDDAADVFAELAKGLPA